MRTPSRAFTLVELLVVIGIISILISILLPSLAAARSSAVSIQCQSNLRQLSQASLLYATDNQGFYPPAHYEFVTANLHRWHGTRPNTVSPFSFVTSPLQPYLGEGTMIRRCGALDLPQVSDVNIAFESACGGYGYNDAYIGSSMGVDEGKFVGIYAWEKNIVNVPAKISQILRPSETVQFTDAAMGQAKSVLIEYSFATSPLFPGYNFPSSSPSVHFRHRGKANIVWADGHTSSEAMEWTVPTNVYGASNQQLGLGWFGPRDNSLFDRD